MDASFERILKILGQVSAPRHQKRDALISFGSDEVFLSILSPDFPLLQMLEPTPIDRDALRIVQYDSCRGLEGWTVINYGYDDFWDQKFHQCLYSPREPGGLFDTAEERAAAFASRWAMIPLTRAMDTLVINISARPNLINEALAKVHSQRTDFVKWMKL